MAEGWTGTSLHHSPSSSTDTTGTNNHTWRNNNIQFISLSPPLSLILPCNYGHTRGVYLSTYFISASGFVPLPLSLHPPHFMIPKT